MIYEKNGMISECKRIELDGKTIFNPTLEQIASAGWVEYIPQEAERTNEQIRVEREEAYKQRSDSLYMAWQKYLALGNEAKTEEARLAWIAEVERIDAEFPYIETI